MKVEQGKRYRVAQPGAKLVWRESVPGGHKGAQAGLVVGDVVVCLGYFRGWGSDPGPDEPRFRFEGTTIEGEWWPQAGMWNSDPLDGALEPLYDGAQAGEEAAQ